jgi:hypothetical protein
LRIILALQTTRAAGPICQPAPSYHRPQTEHASCFRSCIGEAATAGDLAFRRQDCAYAAADLRESPVIDPHRHLSGLEGLPLRRVRTMVHCPGEHQGRFGALPSCGREASDLLGDGNAARSLDGSDGARQRSHDRGDFDSLEGGSVPTMYHGNEWESRLRMASCRRQPPALPGNLSQTVTIDCKSLTRNDR